MRLPNAGLHRSLPPMKFIALWFCAVLLLATSLRAQNEPPAAPPRPTREQEVVLFNGRDFSGFTFSMRNGADPFQTGA